MTEFEFLKAMYWRLHEFECFLAKEKALDQKRKDFINESAVAAIRCSIEDYLKLHRGEQRSCTYTSGQHGLTR